MKAGPAFKTPAAYLSSQFGYNNGINPVEPAFAYIRASREF